MPYQSLIRFLEYTGTDYRSAPLNIARLKKLTAAEFAMQQDGIITIDEVSYTRNDILTELEHPALTERLRYHEMIWEDKSLLGLLEKDDLDFGEAFRWYQLKNDYGFIQFVSPWFAVSFASVLKTLLQRCDIAFAASWMDYLQFVTPGDMETALRPARLFMDDSTRLFRNLNAVSFREKNNGLQMWYEEPWAMFVNKLPEQMLSYTDDLASAIINFTVRIQAADKRKCYEISKQLIELTGVNFSLRETIVNNHAVYKQNAGNLNVLGRIRNNPVYFIVVIVIFFLRFVVSNSSNSSGDVKFSPENIHFIPSVGEGNSLNKGDATAEYLHTFYNSIYASDESKNTEPEALKHIAFPARPMYLIIEGEPLLSNPERDIAIVNNTPGRIKVDVLSAGNLANVVVSSNDVQGFEVPSNTLTDMLLTFDTTVSLSQKSLPPVNGFSYLHVGPHFSTAAHGLRFMTGSHVTLKPYQRREIKHLHLIITIDIRNGEYYYTLGGDMSLIDYKPTANVN
jgi:hypothetical protein